MLHIRKFLITLPMLIAFACLGVSEGIARHGAPMILGLLGFLVAASVGLAVVMG